MIRIIGIDCATQEKNIGVVSADYDGSTCCVAEFEMKPPKAAERIVGLLAGVDTALLCLDAPLGWPIALTNGLINHNAGSPLESPANKMFRRVTDEVIRDKYKKQPLDVGADRIARTAHHALGLLQELRIGLNRPIELAWDHHLKAGVWAIEVYPAATAIAHEIPLKDYKKKQKSSEVIRQLLPTLSRKLQLPKDQTHFSGSEHTFDALLCVLAGLDFLQGPAMPPEDSQKQAAIKEGWIWVRTREP